MRNYVIINGVNSNTINGLAINELPPITKPPMRVLQEEIDGRDGDITTNLGYGAYDKVMTIGLFHTFDINQIIAFFNDTGTIVFSNEPDKKYNYKIIDQIDYEKLISFKTATVTIHCQPFKYPLEEEPIEVTYTYVEGEGETLTLNNTSEAPMEIDLKGNTSQYSTTGKNKFSTDFKTTDTLTTYTKIDSNSYSFTCSGTWKNAIFVVPCKENTDYFFDYADTSNGTYCYIKGTQTQTDLMGRYHGYFLTFNSGANTTLTINISNGNNSNITSATISNIQLEEGTTTTSFEKYSGGSPAPSPSYPYPVNVVSGDNTIEVVGKNINNVLYSDIHLLTNWDGTTITHNSYNSVVVNTKNANSIYVSGDFSTIESGGIRVGKYNDYPSTSAIGTRDNFASSGSINTTNVNYVLLSFQPASGKTFTDIQNSIQIEYGTSSSAYEAYTSQTQLISLGVENLFNISNPLKAYKNSTDQTYYDITIDNGVIKSGGKSGVSEGGYLVVPSKNISNLAFLFTPTFTSSVAKYSIGGFSSTGVNNVTTIKEGNLTNNTDNVVTISNSGNYNYIGISFFGDNKLDISVNNLEITKGTTPQHISTTPIELCKIGDYQDKILKSTGKNLYTNEIEYNNSVLASNGAINSATGFIVSNPISIDISKDIYVSFVAGSLNDKTMRVGYYDSEDNFISRPTFETTPTKLTPPNNAQYLRLSYDARNLTEVQIEYNQATEYEPYGITWYLHKEIGKVVLDGSEENWYTSSGTSQVISYKAIGYIQDTTKLPCNLSSNCQMPNNNIYFYNTGLSLANWKTLLGTTNAIVYGRLATPTNTAITDTTLINQLDNLQNLNSYNPTTNIMQENNDKPFILKVKASAEDSGSVVIDNIGNIYSKPTIALEGNGTGGIYLNDNQILSVELTDKMTISISDMEAFDPDTHALLNRAVTGNYNSMTLQPNENTIKITGGITKATITDYTRWL